MNLNITHGGLVWAISWYVWKYPGYHAFAASIDVDVWEFNWNVLGMRKQRVRNRLLSDTSNPQ